MRKANFKTLVIAGLAAFALLILGAGRAGAQSGLADNFYNAPQGTYVSSAQAEAILLDHITYLQSFVQTLTPGSPAFKATVRALGFYRQVYSSVDAGKQIPESIASGTHLFATLPYGQATKTERTNLKQEVINMLSQ